MAVTALFAPRNCTLQSGPGELQDAVVQAVGQEEALTLGISGDSERRIDATAIRET
jgi:hypothetical protein